LRAEARTSSTPLAVPSRETELVVRVRAGDETACEALYLAHHDALWRFAYAQVRSAAVAEELVQEVFLALWCDRASWEVGTSVRAWLYGAVRAQALDHLRHERVVTPLADARAQLAARAPDADDDALATLPERRRLAMALRWTHDLSAPEIARVLGTTPEAVRVLLTRARQELAALLRRAPRA
jgi:RNA polymerase sigma-70 factor (ECF subfamily)